MMRIDSLSKSYSKTLFENLTFDFQNGINAITGPSGCGKTTLMRIICGLEAPDSGTVANVGKISVLFQEPRLFPWLDALGNASVCEMEKGLAKEILCKLGLSDDLFKLPKDLSGGMKKRVSLARALSAGFDTLLLDEPFSELDLDTARKTMDVIRNYTKEKCVIIITHDTEYLANDDKILKL